MVLAAGRVEKKDYISHSKFLKLFFSKKKSCRKSMMKIHFLSEHTLSKAMELLEETLIFNSIFNIYDSS